MRERKIVLLIDAENTSARYAKRIVNYLEKRGDIICARIYGDFINNSSVKGWNNVAIEYEMEQKQQLTTSSGKNSSDIALVIDAMDLLYQKNIDTLCIVTSDGDFTGLVKRIREDGIEVIGIGKADASKRLEKVCDQYLDFDELSEKASGKDNKKLTMKSDKKQSDRSDKRLNDKLDKKQNDKSDKKLNDKSDKKLNDKSDKKLNDKSDKKLNDKSGKKANAKSDKRVNETQDKGKSEKQSLDFSRKDSKKKDNKTDKKDYRLPNNQRDTSGTKTKASAIAAAIQNIIQQEEQKGKRAELGGIKSQIQIQFKDFNEKDYGYRSMRDFIHNETKYEVVTEGHHTYVVIGRKIWDKRGLPRTIDKKSGEKNNQTNLKTGIKNSGEMPNKTLDGNASFETFISKKENNESIQELQPVEMTKVDTKRRFGFSFGAFKKKEVNESN